MGMRFDNFPYGQIMTFDEWKIGVGNLLHYNCRKLIDNYPSERVEYLYKHGANCSLAAHELMRECGDEEWK
jgi:hypothetical protein